MNHKHVLKDDTEVHMFKREGNDDPVVVTVHPDQTITVFYPVARSYMQSAMSINPAGTVFTMGPSSG